MIAVPSCCRAEKSSFKEISNMNKNQNNLAVLAALAHKALNRNGTEYARNKALIAQFFDPACTVANKEEVRLTLIDSLYSTLVVAKRLFGISDIAEQLRKTFPHGDDQVKAQAALWIKNDFDNASPLCAIFRAKYGVNRDSEEGKAAVSLLSKYLYFATGSAFPIYDALGAKYFSIAKKKAPKDAQKHFRVLQEIMRDNGIKGFDQVDNLFWLYGKVEDKRFSSALNKARYAELKNYRGAKTITEVVKEIRDGKNADTLRDILGADLYAFIQQTAHWD
jgi:hypothetical protein